MCARLARKTASQFPLVTPDGDVVDHPGDELVTALFSAAFSGKPVDFIFNTRETYAADWPFAMG
jgi:hypothetical protein